ncbi:MAG: Gfo/Idh/MocA family oxidoreductase [Rubrivivax sp.]|nr:Gfo/Idh/MocA family oxidoreductase [Rubrivivax sp.]
MPAGGPVRWGFLGAGGIARRRMLPAIVGQPEVKIQAVMVRDQARAEALAAEFHAAQAYDSVAALLADSRIEAVYIATPLDRHLEHVLAAAEAGKAILLEKPMALTVDQAEAMMEAVRRAGVLFAVCLPMRLSGTVAAIAELLRAGRLGELTYLRAQMAKWYPLDSSAWRADPAQSGGGVLMDLGSHLLDLAWYLGGPAEALTASLAQRAFDVPVEDTALVQMRFASGALATLEVSFAAHEGGTAIEVYGTRGQAVALGERVRCRIDGVEVELAPAPVNVYRAELLDFSRALREHRPALTSGTDGRRNTAWLQAAYAGARGGWWVRPAGETAR